MTKTFDEVIRNANNIPLNKRYYIFLELFVVFQKTELAVRVAENVEKVSPGTDVTFLELSRETHAPFFKTVCFEDGQNFDPNVSMDRSVAHSRAIS